MSRLSFAEGLAAMAAARKAFDDEAEEKVRKLDAHWAELDKRNRSQGELMDRVRP